MNTAEVLDIFRSAGAVLEGHFILTSGLRSPVFLQKARVFMHADKTERLCKALAAKIRAEVPGRIDYVVGPAVGGIIPAYETARHLGIPAIWVEREAGEFDGQGIYVHAIEAALHDMAFQPASEPVFEGIVALRQWNYIVNHAGLAAISEATGSSVFPFREATVGIEALLEGIRYLPKSADQEGTRSHRDIRYLER